MRPILEAPIVIIGNGGSGSSLLNQVLGAHPKLEMKGEMKFLIANAWSAFLDADANTLLRNLQQYFDDDPTLEGRIIGSLEQYNQSLRNREADELRSTGRVMRRAIDEWFCLYDCSAQYWGFKEIMNGGAAFQY